MRSQCFVARRLSVAGCSAAVMKATEAAAAAAAAAEWRQNTRHCQHALVLHAPTATSSHRSVRPATNTLRWHYQRQRRHPICTRAPGLAGPGRAGLRWVGLGWFVPPSSVARGRTDLLAWATSRGQTTSKYVRLLAHTCETWIKQNKFLFMFQTIWNNTETKQKQN